VCLPTCYLAKLGAQVEGVFLNDYVRCGRLSDDSLSISFWLHFLPFLGQLRVVATDPEAGKEYFRNGFFHSSLITSVMVLAPSSMSSEVGKQCMGRLPCTRV